MAGIENNIYSAGPLFAYGSAYPEVVNGFTQLSRNGGEMVQAELLKSEVYTYAKATAVPWETDAIPVIGSTILFADGLWAKNKFAKPLQK